MSLWLFLEHQELSTGKAIKYIGTTMLETLFYKKNLQFDEQMPLTSQWICSRNKYYSNKIKDQPSYLKKS